MTKAKSTNEYLDRTLEMHRIYRNDIVPIFRAYEVWRKKEFTKHLIYIMISVMMLFSFVWIIPLCIVFNLQEEFISPVMTVAIIMTVCGILLIFNTSNRAKKFAMTIKTDCLPRILKVFSDIKWVNNENVISNIDLNTCGLFADFNRRTTDDEFKGTYKGVPFRICETQLWHESGSGKNKTVVNIFKGVVITFESNKQIKSRTIIATKGDLTRKNTYWVYLATAIYPIINIISSILCGENITGGVLIFIGIILIGLFITKICSKNEEALDEVKLEDPKFCNKFNAYSSDQVEARYLLTTAFIDRFQRLKTTFGAKKAKCSFYGNQVMFAISTNKNLFEIGSLYKSLENPTSINTCYNELYSILKMAEHFKLDEKIGL